MIFFSDKGAVKNIFKFFNNSRLWDNKRMSAREYRNDKVLNKNIDFCGCTASE